MNKTQFMQCTNGHYYQGDECPYCKQTNTQIKYKPFYDDVPYASPGSKVCPEGHCYTNSSVCPYCGDERVVGNADMHTGNGYDIIVRSGEQVLKIAIGGQEINCHTLHIGYWVWNWAKRHKSSYCIERYNEPIYINAASRIQIGNVSLTGKEFIKMCDVIIDNRLSIIGL